MTLPRFFMSFDFLPIDAFADAKDGASQFETSVAEEFRCHFGFDATLRVVDLGTVPEVLLGIVLQTRAEYDLVAWGVAQTLVGVFLVKKSFAVLVAVLGHPEDLAFIGAVVLLADANFVLVSVLDSCIVAYNVVSLVVEVALCKCRADAND